jgi:hypothetical protein
MKNNGASFHNKAARGKSSALNSCCKGVADPKFYILNSAFLIWGTNE